MNLGRIRVFLIYNMLVIYINLMILRINFFFNLRLILGNVWGNGFYISLFYDVKYFGDFLVMIIYNDVCFSCNVLMLECINMVIKYIGLFLLKK